jgi:fumarate reductase subunit C
MCHCEQQFAAGMSVFDVMEVPVSSYFPHIIFVLSVITLSVALYGYRTWIIINPREKNRLGVSENKPKKLFVPKTDAMTKLQIISE